MVHLTTLYNIKDNSLNIVIIFDYFLTYSFLS